MSCGNVRGLTSEACVLAAPQELDKTTGRYRGFNFNDSVKVCGNGLFISVQLNIPQTMDNVYHNIGRYNLIANFQNPLWMIFAHLSNRNYIKTLVQRNVFQCFNINYEDFHIHTSGSKTEAWYKYLYSNISTLLYWMCSF